MSTKHPKPSRIRALILFVVNVGILSCNIPISTQTPTPTIALERFSPPRYGQVAASEAIVRESADVSSPETVRLSAGATVSVVARRGDWVQIQSPDIPSGTGWVLAHLLDILESSPVPIATVVSTPTLLPPATPTPTNTPAAYLPTPTMDTSIYSSGSLDIPQTWTVDLDEGVVGAGSDADLWFHAVTAAERYVEPQNGATIAVVGTSSIGRGGCIVAPLSTARIHVNDLPAGTCVCVLTNMGRYSEFRVTVPIGPSPGTLSIVYTTW
ncbi:MAG: SH3 domain-containing protein [Chloroflexota bacterium]|nr:SH3 domain-containing protein [Chloroflexota bacterium]